MEDLATRWSNTFTRVGLWFGSLVLSVALFSLLWGLIPRWHGAAPFVFGVTMMFAFPVSCLYLPVVIKLKDAEGSRLWIIWISGTLIGPASLALWGGLLLRGGADPQKLWHGDPLLEGVGSFPAAMIFALIVGFLTTCSYVIGLKTIYRRLIAQKFTRIY